MCGEGRRRERLTESVLWADGKKTQDTVRFTLLSVGRHGYWNFEFTHQKDKVPTVLTGELRSVLVHILCQQGV